MLTRLFFLCTLTAGVLGLVGCRAVHDEPNDIDSIVRTISYDPVLQPQVAPSSTAGSHAKVPGNSRIRLAEKAKTFGVAVGDGLKITTGILVRTPFWIIGSILSDDDDDDQPDDLCTPRDRDDANFNQWLESRDRWRDKN